MPARYLGPLAADPRDMAGLVMLQLGYGDVVVWADDSDKVYAGSEANAENIPMHWIAGMFSLGQPLNDIAESIACLRAERMKDWILTPSVDADRRARL